MHQAAGIRHTLKSARVAVACCGATAAVFCRFTHSQINTAKPAVMPQTPSDHCQLRHCANGTAIKAATAEDKDIVADNAPTTKPIRLGNCCFAKAGNNTLPIAIAADNTTVPIANHTAEGYITRKPIPMSSTTIAPINTVSIPKRRANRAAKGDTSANTNIGNAATKPINEPEMPKSVRITPTTGPNAAKGARRFVANITTANKNQPIDKAEREAAGIRKIS